MRNLNSERIRPEEETDEEDLPYWIGVEDHFGYSVDFSEDSVSIDIEYPSLKPTSHGWAYQKDAAYIGVFSPGLQSDRSKQYSDFLIETEEPVEINGM